MLQSHLARSMRSLIPTIRRHRAWLVLPAMLLLCAHPAMAHVKWFCAYDVGTQPDVLQKVFTSGFVWMALLSMAGLWVGTHLDLSRTGEWVAKGLDQLTAVLRVRTESLMRGFYGAFFIALFTIGNIILTPELTTDLYWVPMLQIGMAMGFLFRPTMVLSALGIVVLYGAALYNYGLFHLLDYPIFLGGAVYFAMCALNIEHLGRLRQIDVLRWGAAITLMWASIEKWAYPEWTYPLFISHARMAMGMDPHFYMIAAGMVEFGLAFALVCRPVASRISAILLTAIFVSAIMEFGKIDAIGHSPIIIILVLIAADNRRVATRSRPILVPLYYLAALAFTLVLYYGIHALMFGTTFL